MTDANDIPVDLVFSSVTTMIDNAVADIMNQTGIPASIMILLLENYISFNKAQIYENIARSYINSAETPSENDTPSNNVINNSQNNE